MRGLSTFSGCGWAYGFTLTPLPPQTLPQIWESLLKSYLVQVCKPFHYILAKTVEPFKLHPMSMSYIYEVFEHLLRWWMGIWLVTLTLLPPQTLPQICESWLKSYLMQVCNWGCRTLSNCIPCPCHTYMSCLSIFTGCGCAYGFTLTSIPPQRLPQISESLLKSYLMQVCKPCQYAVVEAEEPFKLHPMSMSHLYKMVERLLGIWLHTHTFTTTDASQDFERLVEIPPDASGMVQANVGQSVTPPNPSLGLFVYHFLHQMSSWLHKSIHNNTNNQQTAPPWW